YRNLKFLLGKVRSNKTNKSVVKKSPTPSGSIKGGGNVTPKRDAQFFFNRFNGL
ncbi:unnamed protein product, partial [marine sediment metagenome]